MNSLRLIEMYENPQQIFQVNEKIVGGSLDHMLSQREKLTETEISKLAHQLLSVLKFLRDHCVVHRNLTLNTVFLHHHNGKDIIKVTQYDVAHRFKGT